MNPLQESQEADWQKSSTRQQRYPEEFSDFARWRYEEPGLDSHRFGLTVSDVDQVFFHDDAEANEAYILLLEVKTHGKRQIELHEENIYNLLDAVFRQASNPVSAQLWGRAEPRKINYLGWHLLVLSHTRPDNSEWMLWDNKHYIDKDQLVKILRFELAPDTLEETSIIKATELERLKANWKQVIGQAPEDTRRTPVAAILASAGVRPVAIENNTVVLAFRYPIHKEQLERAENKEKAEKIISNYLSYPCHIRCIVEPEYGHLVRAALKLGAEIIDEEARRGEVDNPERQLVTGATGGNPPAPAPNKEAEVTTEEQANLFTETEVTQVKLPGMGEDMEVPPGERWYVTHQVVTYLPPEKKAPPLSKTQANNLSTEEVLTFYYLKGGPEVRICPKCKSPYCDKQRIRQNKI